MQIGKERWSARLIKLGFVGVYFHSGSSCLELQIKSHFVKVQDSMIEQTDIVTVVEVFKEPCHGPRKPPSPSDKAA